VLLGALLADTSVAGPIPGLGVGAGSDWYAGPGGETVASVLGFASAGNQRVSLALGGLRYDDNLFGAGNGALAVIGTPLGASTVLRVTGARFIGDGSFRSWRVKAGPDLRLGADRTLGLYVLHAEDNLGASTSGGGAELGVPWSREFTARFAGGAAGLTGGSSSMQGTVGFTWVPRARVEIAVDGGVARNGAFASVPIANQGARSGPLGLPRLVGSNRSALPDAQASSTSRTEGVMSLGLRAYFP
jgi:hypothetical protein